MGINLKVIAILLFLVACSSCTANKKLFIKEARGVALCRCITLLENQVDSLSVITKDYSQSYFLEYSTLAPETIYRINKFVDDNIDDYIKIPKQIGGNMIGVTCWEFYESSELESFIIKLYKRRKSDL